LQAAIHSIAAQGEGRLESYTLSEREALVDSGRGLPSRWRARETDNVVRAINEIGEDKTGR